MTYPFVSSFHDLGPRRGPVLGLTIHMAEGGGTVGFLHRENPNRVSVHYVIERSGRIVQMLREDHMHSSIRIFNQNGTSALRTTDDPDGFFGATAAKAVLGKWAYLTTGTLGPNHATIGVELEGFAADGPNEAQRPALVALVNDVRSRHPIGLLGHRDHNIKTCPGKRIPWDALGGHGVGGDMPGLPSRHTNPPVKGTLRIPKGTRTIRLFDRTDYTVPVDVIRDATTAQLGAELTDRGYHVNLQGNAPEGEELHFVRESFDVTFTPSPGADCSALESRLSHANERLTRIAQLAEAV